MKTALYTQTKINFMKNVIVFFLLTLSFQLSAQIQETALFQRVKRLNDAIFMVKDSMALEGLLADKVSYGHSTGKIENRQEMIHGAISNTGSYANISFEDFSVFFENNTAIVRHALKGTTIDKDGKQTPLHIGLLQVWVKQKKQWKLTARQAVKLL